MTIAMDYYWKLGLPRYASDADVKKAYRKLAVRWHPKNFAPEEQFEANAKFREISEAFQILSNKQRRMMYDKYGSQGFLDCSDVGIDLDRVDLSKSSSSSSHRLHHHQQQQQHGDQGGGVKDDGVSRTTMKDARGCGTPFKHLIRDPNDVFYETFGCFEPSSKKNGEERTYSGFLHDVNRFEHTFPGFSQTSRTHTTESPLITPSASSRPSITSFKGSVFSSPTDFGDYVTQALSHAIINTRNVITQRTIINGREILTVEEDGKLVLKTVDGEQRDLI